MGDGKKVGETSSGEVVNGFWSCRDLTDVVPLHTPRGLYLKPIAKINVSVNLPQLKTPGKTISTWEVMEKIRTLIQPDEFASLKVAKSTLEFIRLEGDLSDRCRLQRVLARLELQRLNLAGFPNVLKVRVAEAKDEFPNRHSWDSYFRDAKHMNELKPGERPDTIHVTGLPVKWFSEDGGSTPSESVVTKVFKKWGPLRRVDVPAADVYRSRMRLGNNIQKFSFGDGIFFEAYVQYIEYMDFVKAMDALRGMKLLKKESKSCLTAMIKVDFDKSKHMSDSTVSHREFERKRLIAQDSLAAEKLRRKEEVEAQRKEETKKKEAADIVAKEQRRKQREEKRKRKALRVFRKQEEDKVSMKIAREEQKLIKAQRQLESIRLLDELFDRIKIKVEKKEIVIGDKEVAPKIGDKKLDDQETQKSGEKDGDTKGDKKNKKLKKKKSKKDKKKKKKRKKGKGSGSGSSSEDSGAETGKKKIKSVLTVNNVQPSSSAGSAPIDQGLNFPPMYPRFPQAWYYEAALPMLYPAMGRGGSRGGPMNRFPRGRGRGFSARRGGVPRSMRNFNPHIYNEQYYKYFANLAGQEYPDYESDYDSRRGSKSRSRSRGRSKSRSRSRGRSKSRGRSRSRSRSGRRSRRRRSSRSRSRSKSRSRSRSRSRRRGDRSSSRSRSRSRTRSRSRRSRSNKRSKSRTRSKSRSRNASKTRNSRRKRSRSKVKVTRARSRSVSAKRRSHSSSWSMPKSPRQRSCSWSKTVDEKKNDASTKKSAVADKSDAAGAAKDVAPSAQTEVITPD